jgi:hypothetical protein
MPIIRAEGLTKTYRVFQKKEGLLGGFRGLQVETSSQQQGPDRSPLGNDRPDLRPGVVGQAVSTFIWACNAMV